MTTEAVSLDAIFRRNAARRPDALALVDPPNRATFVHGAARCLTYADTERAVTRLAATLRALELPAGAAVALQLPNTAEGVIALLAVLRAGFVAAPLPLLWRRAEGAAALMQIGARAIVTCGRVGDVDHGEVALRMAAEAFSVRYVCGFGQDLPDGIVPLDDVFDGSADGAVIASDDDSDSDALAVVTFDTATGAAAPRGHTALLVGGLTTVLEANLPRHATLLNTILPSSFAALATSVVPWLLTGGTLMLHHPFDAAVLAQQSTEGADAVVVPGPIAAQIERDAASPPPKLIALWREPHRLAADARAPNAPVTDVQAFGEAGIVAGRRNADGTPGRLTTGARRAPSDSETAPVVAHLERTRFGALSFGGPMRPVPTPEQGRDPEAPVDAPHDTGYPCHLDPASGLLTVTGMPAGQVNVGGYCFVMPALQAQIARVGGGGILAALPDALAGQKLAGAVGDPAAMRHALTALGVNPLVARAFRDPRREQQETPAA